MKAPEKIGGAQLLSILFVSRLIALFTFTAPQEEGFPAGDRVLLPLPFFLICLLALLPSLAATGGRQSPVDAAGEVSPLLKKGTGVFYCAVFLLGAALRTGVLGLEKRDLEEAVRQRVPEKFHEMNFRALDWAEENLT